MYTEPQKLKVWSFDDNLQPRCTKTKRQCSLFKDQLSIQSSTYVHNYSVCPRTLRGHWSLSPSTHSHLDFLLVLCSPDSWCWRVGSDKRRERERQAHKTTHASRETVLCSCTGNDKSMGTQWHNKKTTQVQVQVNTDTATERLKSEFGPEECRRMCGYLEANSINNL